MLGKCLYRKFNSPSLQPKRATKKGLVRDDAIAIRTAWQRSDFLSESDRAEAKDLRWQYVDLRVTFAQAGYPEQLRSARFFSPQNQPARLDPSKFKASRMAEVDARSGRYDSKKSCSANAESDKAKLGVHRSVLWRTHNRKICGRHCLSHGGVFAPARTIPIASVIGVYAMVHFAKWSSANLLLRRLGHCPKKDTSSEFGSSRSTPKKCRVDTFGTTVSPRTWNHRLHPHELAAIVFDQPVRFFALTLLLNPSFLGSLARLSLICGKLCRSRLVRFG
jgi:hypothetical protein